MPIHDWTRVFAGIFHDFHCSWTTHLKESLNSGLLPPDYYALSEQQASSMQPDVLTLRSRSREDNFPGNGGVAVAEAQPQVTLTDQLSESQAYAVKRRTVVVHHRSGDEPVALLEIVSPANKDREISVRQFADKACRSLRAGLHVLLIDLFPPGPCDPAGMHGAVWYDMGGSEYHPRPDRPLTMASYESDILPKAYIEPTSVGASLIDMPLFLTPGRYINVPLDETYRAAYAGVPGRRKEEIEA